MGNDITVYYTDNTKYTYSSIADAEMGIMDTLIDTEFSTRVDDIESSKWPNLSLYLNIELHSN